jgi:hypothetical protein
MSQTLVKKNGVVEIHTLEYIFQEHLETNTSVFIVDPIQIDLSQVMCGNVPNRASVLLLWQVNSLQFLCKLEGLGLRKSLSHGKFGQLYLE